MELSEDVQILWTNVTASGLKMADFQVVESGPVGPDTYKEFADTLEAKVFVQKYLPKGTSFVRIKSGAREFDFLLDGARQGQPVVLGFKGK